MSEQGTSGDEQRQPAKSAESRDPSGPPPSHHTGFDWLGIVSILMAAASVRAQTVLWLWKYESPYMLRVSPYIYLVAAPMLAAAGLLAAVRRRQERGGKILTAITALVALGALAFFVAMPVHL